jgi:peptidoglycan/LPS O-acetylase OafA/YrhL
MAWSWYLANDMQFFLVALLIMYVYVRSARAGGGLALALTLMCTVISYVVVVPLNSTEYQNQFYEKPWTRLPPFTAGMLLGMILRDTDLKNRRLSRPIAAALMSLSIAGILFVFYIQYDRYSQAGYDDPLAPLKSTWSKYEFAAYNAFGRLFYIIALGGMCALNASGNGGMIFKFLTLPFWEPMGKLTYGAYLIHPVILRVWYYSHVQYAQFSPLEQAMLFFAAAASSYACAVFTYCLIELPFDALIKRALKM